MQLSGVFFVISMIDPSNSAALQLREQIIHRKGGAY